MAIRSALSRFDRHQAGGDAHGPLGNPLEVAEAPSASLLEEHPGGAPACTRLQSAVEPDVFLGAELRPALRAPSTPPGEGPDGDLVDTCSSTSVGPITGIATAPAAAGGTLG
ncbi:hypothetical protein [Streptomyces atratus]|uniref:hypothetical protein n=1 Tax=Streptomyces atratus TaxID=1893 RepID=UPI0033F5D497